MKLVKFRIKNYKSIVDSDDCYFSDKLTILAGKNESGKTSILEALEDFHEDNVIRESAVPIEGDQTPEVMVTFDVSVADLNEVYEDAEIETKASESRKKTHPRKTSKNIPITINWLTVKSPVFAT